MTEIYHFSDSYRLPWILQDGHLRPGANKIGGFPDPDFLWATSQPQGDRTSSSWSAYRNNGARLVRFTLPRAAFMTWQEAKQRFPQWTPHHVERLERGANPGDWFCRVEPFNLDDVIAIETKSYTSPWAPLVTPDVTDHGEGCLSVAIGRDTFLSRKGKTASGATFYSFCKA